MPAGGDKTADRATDCIPCQLGKQDVEEEREGKQQQTSLSLSLHMYTAAGLGSSTGNHTASVCVQQC